MIAVENLPLNCVLLCIATTMNAIRNGQWNFEPEDVGENQYESTGALPGSAEKVKELAVRAEGGLPLWHPSDRRSFDDTDDALK